jgi:hypothetical protein
VKKPLATIEGTMLTPGVSKNLRRYTPGAIGRAVTRMRERLNDPAGLPIVMRTHHDAGDNSRLIVGRITDVSQQPDGSAAYTGHLFDTAAGRDIGTLIDPGAPALKSTSIHGYWIGPVEREQQGSDTIETADDLEVDAIDFTASPGVTGAQIRAVVFESVSRRVDPAHVITEIGRATISVNAMPKRKAPKPGTDPRPDAAGITRAVRKAVKKAVKKSLKTAVSAALAKETAERATVERDAAYRRELAETVQLARDIAAANAPTVHPIAAAHWAAYASGQPLSTSLETALGAEGVERTRVRLRG